MFRSLIFYLKQVQFPSSNDNTYLYSSFTEFDFNSNHSRSSRSTLIDSLCLIIKLILFFLLLIVVLQFIFGVIFSVSSNESLFEDKPIILISSELLQAHFDTNSSVYHLSLNDTDWNQVRSEQFNSNGCYRKGTLNSTNVCQCKLNYSGSFCSIPMKWKPLFSNQTVASSAKSQNEPKIVLAVVLSNCDQNDCNSYVQKTLSSLHKLINVLLIVEMKSGSSNLNETIRLKQWANQSIVFHSSFVITKNDENKTLLWKAYAQLWSLLFKSIANYRLEDRIVLMRPFSMPSQEAMEFVKFHQKYFEPLHLISNQVQTYSNDSFSNVYRLPTNRTISNSQLMEITNRVYSINYILLLCSFRFDRLVDQRCVGQSYLKSTFEQLYWPINQINLTDSISN